MGLYFMSEHKIKTAFKPNYLASSLWFFFFFICWGACFPYLSLWLSDTLHISSSGIGLVYSHIAIVGVVFQPVFGILSDKFQFRKHLMWLLVILMVSFGPYWIFIFAPLLTFNLYLGAVAGGIFIGLAFSCGCGVCEAYIDKVSRVDEFEFGRARMFGGVGAATGAFFSGLLFTINPNSIFIMASVSGLALAVVLLRLNPSSTRFVKGNHYRKIKFIDITNLFKMPKFWLLSLFMVGVGSVYETYDQQFAVYYNHFFPSTDEGAKFFGYLTTVQIFLDAITMFFAPLIVNRFGPKNALLYCGFIMAFRIIGSAYAETITMISLMKILHGLESSVLIVATFKYIGANFDWRLSATVYLVAFQFSKQISQVFMSAQIGQLYERIGFQQSYVILGSIALFFTLLSIFTLSNAREKSIQSA